MRIQTFAGICLIIGLAYILSPVFVVINDIFGR